MHRQFGSLGRTKPEARITATQMLMEAQRTWGSLPAQGVTHHKHGLVAEDVAHGHLQARQHMVGRLEKLVGRGLRRGQVHQQQTMPCAAPNPKHPTQSCSDALTLVPWA